MITVLAIQHEVAYNLGVSVDAMRGGSLIKRHCTARHVAMYLARALTGMSYPEIGQAFGGRDHSTVIHAVEKVERLWETNGELAGTVDGLYAALGGC